MPINKKEKAILSIVIPITHKNILEKICSQEKRTLSGFVALIVEQYIEEAQASGEYDKKWRKVQK